MAIKWSQHGDDVPKLEQRYRMQICAEFYKRWVQNNDIDPRTTCRNIARRDYTLFVNPGRTGQQRGAGNGDGAAY